MDRFIVKKPRLENEEPAANSSVQTIGTPSPSKLTPPPVDSVDKKVFVHKGRTFQKSWVKSFTWIEWDTDVGKVFCKTCEEADRKELLTFSKKKEDSFIHAGFSNWKKALERFRSHEHSELHKEGIMKLTAFSDYNQNVVVQLNKQVNDEMKKARSSLMVIFTSLKFLSRQGLAIRGHEELTSNFRQLLELRKSDVPDLNEWMGRTGYKWLSHDIQNEIIQLLGDAVLRAVVNEIKAHEFFSIMVDETSDISVKEQVSFCVRTVDGNLNICEDFIGLYQTTNTKATTLFEIVQDILRRLGLSIEKLRGQCYDGAANMSGEFKGLQKMISDLQPLATFIHCTAHSLNLAVQDSLRHLSTMRDIMNLAKDLISTIKASPKRLHIFQNINAEENTALANLRPLCPTRWTMRSSSIRQIIKHYENLLRFFDKFSEEETSDVASKCAGYLETMQKFKTYFFILLFCHVMDPVEEVNTKIQSTGMDATEVESKLQRLLEILAEKRAGFDIFWMECLNKKPDLVEEQKQPRQRFAPKKLDDFQVSRAHTFESPKEFFKQVYIEVIDTVRTCVNERFMSTGLQKVLTVEKECVSAANAKGDNTFKLEKARAFFGHDLNIGRLSLHLSMLGDIAKQRKINLSSMQDIRKLLMDDNTVCQLLPELYKCVKLLRTVPVTTASAERSFSALRRLKTYLRSTMGQKRLNNIALLNTHQSVLDNLDLRPLVNEFIQSNTVRRATFALY